MSNNTMCLALFEEKKKTIKLPQKDESSVSTSEKLVREEIRKLSENAEDIRRFKDAIQSDIANE